MALAECGLQDGYQLIDRTEPSRTEMIRGLCVYLPRSSYSIIKKNLLAIRLSYPLYHLISGFPSIICENVYMRSTCNPHP